MTDTPSAALPEGQVGGPTTSGPGPDVVAETMLGVRRGYPELDDQEVEERTARQGRQMRERARSIAFERTVIDTLRGQEGVEVVYRHPQWESKTDYEPDAVVEYEGDRVAVVAGTPSQLLGPWLTKLSASLTERDRSDRLVIVVAENDGAPRDVVAPRAPTQGSNVRVVPVSTGETPAALGSKLLNAIKR